MNNFFKNFRNGEIGVKNRHFRAFLGNQSLEFSDFWYQGSFLLLLKTDGAGFSKKNFFGQKWRNRCEKYAFSSISRQPVIRFF